MSPHRLSIEQVVASIKANTFNLFLLSIVTSVVCGCSTAADDAKKMGTVSGKVTVQGQPVTAGTLSISSETVGASASAKLEEDGTYNVEGELPVGNYKVYLKGPEIHGLKDKQGNIIPVTIGELKNVPQKYQELESSDLTANVKEGSNELNFDLK